MQSFDVIVIGAGPGGYVAAIRAAQLGLKTAIVERENALGGTCLRIGCIPSKALLNSSHHYAFARHGAAAHGVFIADLKLDLPTMQKRKEKTVQQLTSGVAFLMKKNKITTFYGQGAIDKPGLVSVRKADGNAEQIEAKHIVIATGSVPIDLPFAKPDGNVVVTSTEALAFDKVPESLVVIGAGAIGLELGSVWARLGTKVDVLEFLPRIVAGFDADVSTALQKSLQAEGMKFYLETKVSEVKVENGKGHVTATGKDGATLEFMADKVLVAVGRKANLGGVASESLGLELDDKGRIKTDEHFRTNLPGIYALGDVIAGPMLAHKAEEEGVACMELIAGKSGHVNYDVIPNIVYTHPEAASAGLGEDAAKAEGRAVKVGKFPYKANGRAIAGNSTDGFVKIIADAKTDRILGAQILSPSASELIAEVVAVMEFNGSAEDLGRTVHGHPTLSEATKEAALAADGRATQM